MLAVGDARAVRSLVQSLTRGWGYGYSVVGVCLTGRSSGGTIDIPGVGTLPVLGDESKVHDAILKTNADTVALTTTDHLGPEGVRNCRGTCTTSGWIWSSPPASSTSQARA